MYNDGGTFDAIGYALFQGATTDIESSDDIKPNALIDIFEESIDKYQIADFIDYDFANAPLHISRIEAVFEFIWDIRGILPKFRRNQNSVYDIIDFINIISEYLSYLGEQMGSDDGERFYRLRNIDLHTVQENVLSFRRELNKIYRLISNGGTLSIYGL